MSGPPPIGRGRGNGRGRVGPKPAGQAMQPVARWPAPAAPQANQWAALPKPSTSAQQSGAGDASRAQQLAGTHLGGRPGNGRKNRAEEGTTGGEVSTGRGGMRGRKLLDINAAPPSKTRPAELSTKQGKRGVRLSLYANYFKIEKRPTWELYHYRVDFSEEEDRAIVRRAWMNQHKNTLGNAFIYAGNDLFLARKLNPNLQINIPDWKLSLWPGYLTSIRQHESDILLCCDFTHKVMRMDTAYDVLVNCSGRGDYQERYLKDIIGCTVLTPYNNKTYRVDDVNFEVSPRSKFSTKDGDITFQQYYKKRYDIDIREFGKNSRGEYQKLPAGPMANWTRSSQKMPMFNNASLQNWVMVVPKDLAMEAQSFFQIMQRVGREMGFHIPTPRLFEVANDRASILCDAIDKIVSQSMPDLILFAVMNDNADRYSAIKKKCYVDRAVSSQVIQRRNLAGKNAMTVATKVAIQLNCKLGGAPWAVSIPSPALDTMVVGYDVCHDGYDKSKSYAALVATTNSGMTSWFSTVAHHSSGEELYATVAQDVFKACKQYAQVNNKLPAKILIYRDGVGDGQLQQVEQHEVEKIKKLLTQLYGGPNWKLIYIVVTKRINTRLFKADVNYSNVTPGTVVDDVITLPEKYDFYLVSQNPMQGTASPVSYNVISDNVGWPVDLVQTLTYRLTHLYYNFSGSVCVPAPVQYAHKLAFLTSQNLHRAPNVSLSDRLYFL